MANLAAHVHLMSGRDWHRVLLDNSNLFSGVSPQYNMCLYQWSDIEFPVMPVAVVFSRNTLLVTEKIFVPDLFEPWQTHNYLHKMSPTEGQ